MVPGGNAHPSVLTPWLPALLSKPHGYRQDARKAFGHYPADSFSAILTMMHQKGANPLLLFLTFLVQLCLFEMQVSSFVGVAKRSKGQKQCISLDMDPPRCVSGRVRDGETRRGRCFPREAKDRMDQEGLKSMEYALGSRRLEGHYRHYNWYGSV